MSQLEGQWFDASGAAPKPAFAIGTRLRLESEGSAWGLIVVCGMFDSGPDAGGYELVVKPVEMRPDEDVSPRKVPADTLVTLGYEVES